MCFVAMLAACGSSPFRSYEPVEFALESRAATFAKAQELMRERDLRMLEEDEERGLISTQWDEVDGQHYNIQILLSPVRAVVTIGCRIEKGLDLRPCDRSNEFPRAHVRLARELTEALR